MTSSFSFLPSSPSTRVVLCADNFSISLNDAAHVLRIRRKLTLLALSTGLREFKEILFGMDGIQNRCHSSSRSVIRHRPGGAVGVDRSEEHTSELQSHSFISYA